jgi:hypothetical protein
MLVIAIVSTLFWVVLAFIRPLPHDRWLQTFTWLTMTSLIALGIAANRLRKRQRVSLKK